VVELEAEVEEGSWTFSWNRPILTDFRGCFPHAVDELMIMVAIVEIWIHFVNNETLYLKNNMIKNVNDIIRIAYK
jgi:hypothetical protein